MINFESIFGCKIVNKLIDLKCLQQRLFLMLHDWQNLEDFIVGFLFDYFIV